MERKKSSGKPFQMRSGNSTPYPFLGKALKAIGGGAVGAIKNMLPGSKGNSGGAGSADDVNTKIDEIHAALVGGDEMSGIGEGRTLAEAAKQGAMTKKTHMYTHADTANPTEKVTDPDTGRRHYHAAKTESQLPKNP